MDPIDQHIEISNLQQENTSLRLKVESQERRLATIEEYLKLLMDMVKDIKREES